MTQKTIPELPATTSINDNALFVIDSIAETFKMTAANVALYMREALLPAGMISPYAGSTAPSGWLLCDGSVVSRTTYSRLFSAIGATFGAGDGSTTFAIPDLRGRVAAGKDDMGGSAAGRLTTGISGVNGTALGATGGSEASTGTIGGTQSIAHTHTIAHVHQAGYQQGSSGNFVLSAQNSSITTWTNAHGSAMQISDNSSLSTGGLAAMSRLGGGAGAHYTSGALSAASGSSGSTAASGAMSANSVVNFANATFTATGSKNVQPTIVLNQIIKT